MNSLGNFPLAILFPAAAVLAGCNGGDNDASGSMPGGHSNQGASTAQQSTNWSGYVRQGTAINRVRGSWIVPHVSCSGADNTSSSSWAGIGGFATGDPTLIQAGTGQDCSGGPSYYAWWEIIPLPAVNAGGGLLDSQDYAVKAGDHITVSIDGTAVIWNITIENSTEGWTFNQTVPYVTPGLSAEWIEEAPLTFGTGGAGQAALANYGQVSFSGLSVNGAAPALTVDERVAMVNSSGQVVSNPSAPKSGGNAFDVCFGPGGC